MTILYVFQIRTISKKTQNAVKRRFYYNFKKLKAQIKLQLFSKNQMFVVENKYQTEVERFFQEYLDWIEYYRIHVEKIDLITKNKTS